MRIGLNGYVFGITKDRIGQYATFLTQSLIESYPDVQFVLYTKQKLKIVLPKNCTVEVFSQHTETRKKWEKGIMKLPSFARLDYFHSFSVPQAESSKSKYGFTLHSGAAFRFRGFFFTVMLQKMRLMRLVKGASMIVTVTDVLRKEASRMYSLPLNSLRVIPGASNLYFQKSPETATLQKVQKEITRGFDFLLYVGKVRKKSNIVQILEAFAKMVQEPRFSKLKLIITGRIPYHKDGFFMTESEIKALLQNLKIASHVILPGPVSLENLRALYKLTRGVVCDTTDFGFPAVAFEGSLAGAAMAIPSSPEYEEFFQGEFTKYHPGNPKSLRLALSILADQVISKNEQVVKAQMTAHSYSWADAARSLMQAIQQAVEKK